MKKALLIGIKGPNIEGIVKSDVQELKNAIGTIDSEYLISTLTEGCSKNNVVNTISNWVDSLSGGDEGVLYISSHASKESNNAFIHAEGYNLDQNEKITQGNITDLLSKLGDGVKTEIILDLCYAQSFYNDSFSSSNMSFWASSGSNKKSFSDDGNMSLFTACLISYSGAPNRSILIGAINNTLSIHNQIAHLYGPNSTKFLQ